MALPSLTGFVARSAATRITAAWLNAVGNLVGGATVPEAYAGSGDTANWTLALADRVKVYGTPGTAYSVSELALPASLRNLDLSGCTVSHAAVGANAGVFYTTGALTGVVVQGGTLVGVAGDAVDSLDTGFSLLPGTATIGDLDFIIFQGTRFETFRGYAIHGGYAKSLYVDQCVFPQNTLGINWLTSRGVWITNNHFDGGQYTGSASQGVPLALNTSPNPASLTSDDQNRGIHVTGNHFRNITHHQTMLLHGINGGEVAGNTFHNCSAPISVHGATGITNEGHADFTIHHNTIVGSDTYGDASHGSLFATTFNHGIELSGVSSSNELVNVRVEGNVIRHMGYAAEAATAGAGANTGGILVNGFTRRLTIAGNTVEDCQGHGILAKGKQTRLLVERNTVTNTVSSGGTRIAISLDDDGTSAAMTGFVRHNIVDGATYGVSQGSSATDASGLYCADNEYLNCTAQTFSSGASPMRTPYMAFTASPVAIDATVTRFARCDCGATFTLSPTTGSPRDGDLLTLEIYNGTAGAMSAITKDASFHVQTTLPLPDPGAVHQVTFRRKGALWQEIARTTSFYA